MTRWARKQKATGTQVRKEEVATSWAELKAAVVKGTAFINPDLEEDVVSNAKEKEDIEDDEVSDTGLEEDEELVKNVFKEHSNHDDRMVDDESDDDMPLEALAQKLISKSEEGEEDDYDLPLEELAKQVTEKPFNYERKKYFFEGSWVSAARREELIGLRDKLRSQGLKTDVIEDIVKKERRKDELKEKRNKKNVCYHCRQKGHFSSNCPEAPSAGSICYRCGSGDHIARSCRAKTDGGSYPLAQCFVCKNIGHISRECPENPNGLYPNGGSCRLCGDVTHFARECPKFQKKTPISARNSFFKKKRLASQRRGPRKVVKF